MLNNLLICRHHDDRLSSPNEATNKRYIGVHTGRDFLKKKKKHIELSEKHTKDEIEAAFTLVCEIVSF